MSKRRRRRLPNGFGQITEIKGKRLERPFRAMVTVGKTDTGRPICKLLKPVSYFKSYNDAYAALVEYNRTPYDVSNCITANALFENWVKTKISVANDPKNFELNSRRAWKYCSAIYDLPFREIRIHHLRDCIENGIAVIRGSEQKAGEEQRKLIKSLFNQLFDYAIEYDIVNINYARNFKIGSIAKSPSNRVRKEHISYSVDELEYLWQHTDNSVARLVLIQCYSGWRPGELMDMLLEDVNITDWTFKGGKKTEAGRNRVVPIHSAIQKLVKYNYDEAVKVGSEYLFNREDKCGKYTAVDNRYIAEGINRLAMGGHLDPNHRPHDGRKCFVTLAKKYNMDEYTIKKIVGHAVDDLTEKVYTQRDIEWLRAEIEKIKVGV